MAGLDLFINDGMEFTFFATFSLRPISLSWLTFSMKGCGLFRVTDDDDEDIVDDDDDVAVALLVDEDRHEGPATGEIVVAELPFKQSCFFEGSGKIRLQPRLMTVVTVLSGFVSESFSKLFSEGALVTVDSAIVTSGSGFFELMEIRIVNVLGRHPECRTKEKRRTTTESQGKQNCYFCEDQGF